MNKFNATISVIVSVDSIANNLLDQMNPAFKHRELVVETLIGRMLSQDKSALSRLYNALNGYLDDINFQVGDVVVTEDVTAYGYWEEPVPGTRQQSRKKVAHATVVEINKHADHTLKVSFEVPKKDGTMELETQWTRHTECKMLKTVADSKVDEQQKLDDLYVDPTVI
jgi:hypothetical protein